MHPHCRQDKFRFTLAAFLLLCSVGTARCQTSANLAMVSAYTARGVSLDTRPALQLRIEHDTAAGWYGGAFASPVRLDGQSQGQLIAYGGRAQRVSSTLTLDAGASYSRFLRNGSYNFTEFYAGLALGRSSARLFYSPKYYGGGQTLYLDLGSAYPLSERVSLAVHAGALHPFGEYRGAARDAADLRVSLATDVGDVRLQAGWQASWHPYLPAAPARALTASASLYF